MAKSLILTAAALKSIEGKTLNDEQVEDLMMNHKENYKVNVGKISEVELMISPCHRCGVEYHEGKFICSRCSIPIRSLNKDESIKYSSVLNASQNVINSEITMREDMLARRFSQDTTYELKNVKCPICNRFSRLVRSNAGVARYVCTFSKCRNVFIPQRED